MIPLAVFLVIPPAYFVYKYNESKNKLLGKINSDEIKVYRVKEVPSDPYIKCLELDPEFIKENWETRKIISLGQYFSMLRYTGDDETTEQFLKDELTATFGRTIMGAVGGGGGAALLPMILGKGRPLDKYLQAVAGNMAHWLSQNIVENNRIINEGEGIRATPDDQQEEVAMFPLSISEIMTLLNINQTLTHGGELPVPPLEMLKKGEIEWGNTFEGIMPNPFNMETDYHDTIAKMEDLIRETNPDYDPNYKGIAPPVPVNPRILPDLYMGAGDAEMSHTAREGLENRLCSIILNKLTYNYYKVAHDEDDLFVVNYNGKVCTHPEQLVKELIETGHQFDVAPRCQVTSFGVKFCVKEEDGTFMNVPMAIMLRSGFERYNDNRPVTFAAPHGGMDMYIRGPLVGTTNSCAMQFYVAYKGLCGFHADQDTKLPWIQKSPLAKPYDYNTVIRATRMAGLVSVASSIIATEMNLPFGGYGLLGVCNDLSGIIDLAVNDYSDAYPLTSSGRYIGHYIRCLTELEKKLEKVGGHDEAIHDIKKLVHSYSIIDTDLHASPAKAANTAERFKITHNRFFFKENAISYDVMNEIAKNYSVMADWHGETKIQETTVTKASQKAKWGRR